MRVLQNLIDIRFLSYIPRTDVCGNATSTQAVACHQYTTIVFHHTFPVAIDVMERQHDAYTNLTLSHIGLYHFRFSGHIDFLCRRRCRHQTIRRIWYLDKIALFQFVARRVHIRIRINQFLNGKTIITSYAKYGFPTLHFVHFPICLHL